MNEVWLYSYVTSKSTNVHAHSLEIQQIFNLTQEREIDFIKHFLSVCQSSASKSMPKYKNLLFFLSYSACDCKQWKTYFTSSLLNDNNLT